MTDTPREPVAERIITALSPSWAAQRARGRREKLLHDSAAGLVRKYEAASTGRRTKNWIRPGTSADTEINVSAALLRNGARQLVRDNGHAANAVSVLANNVIGTGIQVEIEAQTSAATARLGELWEAHMETGKSGAEGVGNFYQRQALGFRAIVESGAVLSRRRRRATLGAPLPYQVQLLEPDFLATYLLGLDTQAADGNITYQGKEYDAEGNVVAYHLYKSHPGDNLWNKGRGLSRIGNTTRVLAADIAHAYRLDRPGQSDGVSWFAPIMTALRDLSDTRDAYQLRLKLAACFVAFVTEPEIGTGSPASINKTPIAQHLEPGRIESLPLGKSVEFARPPGVEGLSDFDKAQLMTIAAGLGIPYEALTGDLRNVSFLSGRMGWLAFYRNIDAWRTYTVIPRICEPELEWFLNSAAVAGLVNEPVRVTWTAPHRDLLDPLKEIKALREEMRLGILSYGDAARMRGRNPLTVLDNWEKWAKDVDDRELVFDWDPRQVALSGTGYRNEDEDEGVANAGKDED